MTQPVNVGLNCICISHEEKCCPRKLTMRLCCCAVEDEDKEERIEKMIESVKRAPQPGKSEPILIIKKR